MTDFPCCDPEAADDDPQRIQLIDVADHQMVIIVGRDNHAQIILNCSVADAAEHLVTLAESMLHRAFLGEIQSEENHEA